MAILLSDSNPSSTVDDSGNVEIAAPSSGNLELQDSTGTTQILLSDTGVSLAGGAIDATPAGVDTNQLVTMHDGLIIEVDQTSDTPLTIRNSSGDTILRMDEDGDFMLSGSAVNEIVSSINEAEDTSKQLATVAAITSFVNTSVSGVLDYEEFNTKAEFDTYLTQTTISPAIVLVKDATPFDYTDTGGNVQTDLTWWLGIVQRPTGEALSTSTLFDSNSQDSLTGPEISAALYAQANTNQYTDADRSAVQTIDDKMDKTSSDVNLILENTGNGNGYILLRNTSAPVNHRDFALVSRGDGSFDFESRLDDGTVEKRWTYEHEGDSYFPGSIFQNSQRVLDVTATTNDISEAANKNYVSDAQLSAIGNLPSDTSSALSSKLNSSLVTTNINAASGRIPDAPTVSQAIGDAIATVDTFNGGTINQKLISVSDDKNSITLKASANVTANAGVAWQNSGSFYTASIHREPTDVSDDLLINVGSSPQLDDVPNVAKFKNEDIALEVTRGGIHAQGDIFAFGGNMAAGTITATDQFVSDTIRISDSSTDNNWGVYKADQGSSTGLGGTIAADGRNFSGQALRLRVANNTDQGFILENETGVNLFEVEGSSGQASFAGPANFLDDVTVNSFTVNGPAQLNDNGLTINNPGTGNGYIELNNSSATNDKERYRIYATSTDHLRIASFNDAGVSQNAWEFKHNGDTHLPANLEVDGFISMFDVDGHEHRFEHGSEGITLRTLSNPSDGEAIFTVESSGSSKRLVIPHAGSITTSNPEIRVGTNADGTGGHPVLTPNNIGDLIASYTYVESFPNLSQADITEWFQRMAHVQFLGVGSGVITLPQIVGAETTPTSSQVVAGSTIVITNYNSGSNIALGRFNSGQTFIIDNVGDTAESAMIFSSSKIELQALDIRGYSAISENWCWAIRGI